MSVLIKGIELPEKVQVLELHHDGKVFTRKGYLVGEAVELPDKHGDLIDRQKLIEDNKHLEYPTDGKYRRDRAWAVGFNAGARHCNEHAVYAKTVIEAEDGT